MHTQAGARLRDHRMREGERETEIGGGGPLTSFCSCLHAMSSGSSPSCEQRGKGCHQMMMVVIVVQHVCHALAEACLRPRSPLPLNTRRITLVRPRLMQSARFVSLTRLLPCTRKLSLAPRSCQRSHMESYHGDK